MGLITLGVSGYIISSSASECVEETASVSSPWAAARPDLSGFTSMSAATKILSLHLEQKRNSINTEIFVLLPQLN